MRSSGNSPMPTRMPLVKGIFSSPAARIVSRRTPGCFVGEPWWTTRSGFVDSSMRPCDARDLAQPGEIVRLSITPMFVCGRRPRSSARSHAHAT